MDKRRLGIISLLNSSEKPIRGTDLATRFNVTRQVIVKDIALLRAEGENIIATNRGYIIPKNEDRLIKTLACSHSGYEEIEDELNTIVDFGGVVKDVLVDHPVYGELRTQLEIKNRKDVIDFLNDLKSARATPLSSLTSGVHLHNIQVEDMEMFENIKSQLLKKGYLLD